MIPIHPARKQLRPSRRNRLANDRTPAQGLSPASGLLKLIFASGMIYSALKPSFAQSWEPGEQLMGKITGFVGLSPSELARILKRWISRLAVLGCISGIVGLFASPALATPPTEILQPIALATLMPQPEALRLRHTDGHKALAFTVSPRRKPTQAKLHLEFTNSNALIGHRSQLRVLLNGWQVAQLRLDPDNPIAKGDIILPVDKLKPGYNRLQFRAAQHYTDEHCEFPQAPELWTEIDTLKSHLSIESTPLAIEPSLASLGQLLNETLKDYEVDIVHAGERKTVTQLSWGGLVAQGVALRLKYAPFKLHLLDGSGPGDPARDRIVIGKRDDLREVLNTEQWAAIQGAYLGIAPRAGHPEAFQLVVAGTTDAEVTRAAQAFTQLSFPLPDAAETLVETHPAMASSPIVAPGQLHENQAYSLAQLGFRNVTFRAPSDEPAHLTLHLPPDLYAPETAEVELWLHLAYRPTLRQDSVLNILLNGQFAKAVPLKDENGAEYFSYKVGIPLRAFLPGENILSFEPQQTPLITGSCLLNQDRLYVTVHDDSLIRLPDAQHYASLPDLSLFARTGFPFTSAADGSRAAVQLLDDHPKTLAAAWQVLGRLAQINRAPLTQTIISRAPADTDRHTLAIGSESALDDMDMARAPVQLGQLNRLTLVQGPAFEPARLTWLERLERALNGLDGPIPAAMAQQTALLDTTAGLGDYRMAMAYPSTEHKGHLVLALVAASAAGVLEGAHRVTSPELWYNLKGDVAIWKNGPETLAWQDTGRRFFVGDAGASTRLLAYFARYPWIWIGVVLLLLLLTAWSAHHLLHRYKLRHHGDVKEFES